MASEDQNKNQGNPKQNNDSSGKDGGKDGGKKRSRRRYYRRRGKGKKSEQSQGGKQEPTGQAKPDGGKAEGSAQDKKGGKTDENKSANASRRKRRSRNRGKQSSQDQSSKSRSRRGRRRAPVEPMVEVGIEVPEPKNYVPPDEVYIYEFMIRPAYRDASDYRPDSFPHRFDEADQHTDAEFSSALGTHYASQYISQYPTEIHPEDAPFVDADAELPQRPGEVIRAYFANLPPEEEIDTEVSGEPDTEAEEKNQ